MRFGGMGRDFGRMGTSDLGGPGSNPLFHRNYTVHDIPASATYYTFPARVRPIEPLRTQLIIKNVGTSVLSLGYAATGDNSIFAPTGYSVTLSPGQEFSENGSSTRGIYCRPLVSGQGGRFTVYVEMNGAAQSGVATTRGFTALPFAPSALSVIAYASGVKAIGISRDKTKLFGSAEGLAGGTALYESSDNGENWSSIATFADNVMGFLETEDGEALVLTASSGETAGKVFKSSGWAVSHSGATWSNKLSGAAAGYFRPFWSGGHSFAFSGAYGTISEYGPQLISGTDPTYPTHFYFTADYGDTWSMVLDLQTRYSGHYPVHAHGVSYDPYWRRLWAVFGDVSPADNLYEGQSGTMWLYADLDGSDNVGSWNAVALPTEWQNISSIQQEVNVAPLKDRILFGSDDEFGVWCIPRVGYRQMGTPYIASVIATHTGAQFLPGNFHRNAYGDRLLLACANKSSDPIVPSAIMIDQADDGRTLAELWRDDSYQGANGGLFQTFGPTANNIVVGATTDKFLRGTLIPGTQGDFDRYAKFTGDGSTLVFKFPHFLSSTPTAVAYPQNAAAAALTPTVTTDAYHIILTFSVAPTNATAYSYALRYQGANSADAFSLTYTDHKEDAVGGATITYTSAAIGAADANRLVVVGIGARTNFAATVTSVTIGGVTATRVSGAAANVGGNVICTDIFYANVPSGTTASVVVTYGSTTICSAIAVYRLITSNQTPVDGQSANNASASSSSPVSKSATVPPGGGSIAVFSNAVNSTGVTHAWSGGNNGIKDQDVRYSASGRYLSTLHDPAADGATTYTVTPSTASAANACMSIATWQR